MLAAENKPTLGELRRILADKFPAVAVKPNGSLRTGLTSIDSEGGLNRGALTELVSPLGGGGLFLHAMLSLLTQESCFGALIDAGNSFEAQDDEGLLRLLWVRCAGAMQAIKATDLVVRDGNLQLVVLDLQLVPVREVCRIPASTWHRFQRLVESTSTALVVLTSQPVVEGAKMRVALRQRWTLDAMRLRRRTILDQMTAQVFARRQFSLASEQASA